MQYRFAPRSVNVLSPIHFVCRGRCTSRPSRARIVFRAISFCKTGTKYQPRKVNGLVGGRALSVVPFEDYYRAALQVFARCKLSVVVLFVLCSDWKLLSRAQRASLAVVLPFCPLSTTVTSGIFTYRTRIRRSGRKLLRGRLETFFLATIPSKRRWPVVFQAFFARGREFEISRFVTMTTRCFATRARLTRCN